MKKLSYEDIQSKRPDKNELFRLQRFPVVTILENIRSLYNVGSMFRTADAARIAYMYLCGYTPYPPRKEIEKTALGSTESVPWEHSTKPQQVIKMLKNQGFVIAALEHTTTSVAYTTYTYSYPLCIVVGNEVHGVSDDVLAMCDTAIEIPMFGIKHSLNVAVAYGIVVYHAVMEYQMK
ncbi:MAG TPA: RNA methyltransferase [Spirochaetota bacterium]|nr:RNA methyltransferase [Spirochaetota bacterium]HQQ50540.1 RNA methyltransferase [Spirochaetota bacterium]